MRLFTRARGMNASRISDSYIYVLAVRADIPQIYGVERMSFPDPWSRAAFDEEFKDGHARYFVAKKLSESGRETDIIAGFCGYWQIIDEAHITNVAVHPSHRRLGVGAGLLDAMLADARALGITAATLEVREDNYEAISLYERFGFRREGVRKKYYENGSKDALIMWNRFA